jgi:antitoxin component YwqK of YwqJK toxin-antitoxin module
MKKILILILILTLNLANIYSIFSQNTYPNGQIKVKGNKTNGKWVEYYDNGQVLSKGKYIYGKKEGEWVSKYKSGRLKDKITYVNGKKNGEYLGYHENGKIWRKTKYISGKQDGEWVEYYDNGQLKVSGKYNNGLAVGEWLHYNENGQIEATLKYINGELQPPLTRTDKNNNLAEAINCELARKKYLEQNPDVAKAGMDAWNHYTTFGKREGRKWPACSENSTIFKVTENDQTSLLNKCEIDGKLFYNDAVKYIGDCDGDKANGWGTLYLNNGNRLFGNFRENKLQDNFIEWFFAKEGNTIIGPNKGSSLHGPCININSNNSTGIANYDNGKYIASNGYFLQEAPKFIYNETFNVADGYGVKSGKLIPGTNNVIFTSMREYNSKGNWKCWITLLSLENNQIIFNYGSYEKPIISQTDSKPELPNFISFSTDKLFAYYDIKGHRDDPPKYLKCNLQNGGLEILDKLPVSISNIIDVEKILNERYFDKYEAIGYGFINNVKYKYVLLSDSSYLKAFNNSIYSKSIDNFSPVYGSGAKLVYFSKNHEVLKSIDFDGVTIYDFAVDNNSDRIALSYKSKDSTFLSYFNLTSLDKISDIFRKGNISPGTVKFSNTGTYLLYNDLLFLGNKLYFAIPGGTLYDFNEKDNTALINAEGTLRAYDIEHRRILWEFNIGDNYINTGFFKVANDFVIISGRVLSWEGYKPKENGIKIYRFNIPEPNLSLTEYKKNPDFLKQFATIDVAEKKQKSEVLESVKQDEKKLEKSKSDELVDMFTSYLLYYLVSEMLNPSSPSYSSNSRPNSSASSNSQSSTTQASACTSCKGTGVCPNCSKAVKKPYSKDGCGSTEDRSEIKTGYILCNSCDGWGYLRTNVNCPCSGWCYEKDCYYISCMDGWIFCKECNYNGNGSNLGKCYACKGTGKKQ